MAAGTEVVVGVFLLASVAEVGAVAVEVAPFDIESTVDGEVPLEAVVVVFPEEDAEFGPCGGDDLGLDAVALHSVESGRFMDLVDDAERNQKKTGLKMVVVFEIVFKIGLLQFPHEIRAGIVRVKVLQLDFGDEAEAVVELVGCEEDEAVDIELVRDIAGVEMRLAVGAEAEAVIPLHVLWHGEGGIDIGGGKVSALREALAEGVGGCQLGGCEADCGKCGRNGWLVCFHLGNASRLAGTAPI